MAGFDLNALFQQAQQIQEQMKEAQERLAQKIVTGSSGGGMVIVTANGKGEIQKVQIDKQAVDPRDVPMLEDLVLAAVNSVLKAAQEAARDLAQALSALRAEVRLCSTCCNLTAQDPCTICRDERRDSRMICVVETVPDLLAVERTREFRGRYHVLHGALSPLDGVGPDQLKLKELVSRLGQGVEEVIVATDPTVEGEGTPRNLTDSASRRGGRQCAPTSRNVGGTARRDFLDLNAGLC